MSEAKWVFARRDISLDEFRSLYDKQTLKSDLAKAAWDASATAEVARMAAKAFPTARSEDVANAIRKESEAWAAYFNAPTP